jgi:hypothetical protein
MNDIAATIARARAAAKSLRWLEFQFSGVEGDDEGDKLARCIHLYSKAGADNIYFLADRLEEFERLTGKPAELASEQAHDWASRLRTQFEEDPQ